MEISVLFVGLLAIAENELPNVWFLTIFRPIKRSHFIFAEQRTCIFYKFKPFIHFITGVYWSIIDYSKGNYTHLYINLNVEKCSNSKRKDSSCEQLVPKWGKKYVIWIVHYRCCPILWLIIIVYQYKLEKHWNFYDDWCDNSKCYVLPRRLKIWHFWFDALIHIYN